jgi:hypothetical protein
VPLTVPTHPVAVLPLKMWRPHWFDGVALAVGSTAPDLAYPLDGTGLAAWPLSHQVRGLVLWCLPVTLVLSGLLRRAIPVIAAHLPGPLTRLSGYAFVGWHRWHVTVASALIGAASHLALDRLENLSIYVEYGLHVLGFAGLAWIVRRLPSGGPPGVRPQWFLFWGVAAAVSLPCLAMAPFLPGAYLVHATAVRLLCFGVAGPVVAAFIVRGGSGCGRPPSPHTSPSPPGRARGPGPRRSSRR